MNTIILIIKQTMIFAVPLLIVALGAMCSEKSGITNIGLEGIMIIGAFAGVVTINTLQGAISGQLLFIIAMLISALVGGIYSLLHAWTSIKLRADQTISGTALNIFAPAFCIFLSRNFYGSKQVNFPDLFFIKKVPVLGDIPIIGPCLFQDCYISTFIGIILLAILGFILNKTVFGLRLSSCGENPNAAAGVGISVSKMRYIGVLISGLLGGIGGIIFIVQTSTNFSASVAGYGFLALAVLILGQWKPRGILLASLLFGIMKAISSSYSGIPILSKLNIASEIYKIIPYVLTLVVLVISSKKSISPKALGKPYDDGTGFIHKFKSQKTKIIAIVSGILIFVLFTGAMLSFNLHRNVSKSVSTGYGAEIALVIDSTASIDDKSFTQSEWEGLVDYSEETGTTIKYYQAKDDSDEILYNTARLAIKGNAKVVILSAQCFSKVAYILQEKFPQIKFILVDGIPVDSKGNEKICKNMLCYSVREEQSGFLAGYAAVKDGYRSLGYIGGMAVSSVVRYGYGYVQGIDYAAQELGLGENAIKVRYNYAGTFLATPEVLSMASSWYRNDTDIIFACGGSLGNSVMKAAESCDKKVIGVDSDQSNESKSVITSAMKNVGEGLKFILRENDAGKLKFGRKLPLSAKEGAVELPMKTSRFKKFNKKQYIEIYKKIAHGDIDIKRDDEADTVNDLPLKCTKVVLVR